MNEAQIQKDLLLWSGIPPLYMPPPAVPETASGRAWQDCFFKITPRLGSGFTIALTGNRGSGKTQLGCSLIKEVIRGKTQPALYTTATRLFARFKETYRKDSCESELEVLAKMLQPSLLVIDEIGKRGQTEWENNLFFDLLNDRHGHLKDTLLIDNQSVASLKETLGPSICSRMQQTGGIMECNWPSFREKKAL